MAAVAAASGGEAVVSVGVTAFMSRRFLVPDSTGTSFYAALCAVERRGEWVAPKTVLSTMTASPSTPDSRENVSDASADNQNYQQARERLLRGYLEQVGDRFVGLSHDVRDGDVAPEDVIERLDELQAEADVAKLLVEDE